MSSPIGPILDAALAVLDADTTPAERNGAIFKLLTAAGFTKLPALIPLASELSGEQRAVVLALSERPLQIYGGWAVPNKSRSLRRWVDPSLHGVLERQVHTAGEDTLTEPIWRTMARSTSERDAVMTEHGLTLDERLEVFGDVYLGAYNIERHKLSWGSLGEIGERHGKWAARIADELCKRRHGSTTLDIKWPVFLGLVRGGISIEPRWDWLLPVDADASTVELSRQCAEAVPAERRDAALAKAAASPRFASAIVSAGLRMLAHFPSRALADAILARAEHADAGPRASRVPKKQLLASLDRIGARSSEVAAAVAVFRDETPPVPLLRCTRGVAVTDLAALDETQRAQLALAGRGYDGRAPDDPLQFLELYTITNESGDAIYDAWLYMADSGSIYATGTTREVAHIIQSGVECDDPGLREGLRDALRDRSRLKT